MVKKMKGKTQGSVGIERISVRDTKIILGLNAKDIDETAASNTPWLYAQWNFEKNKRYPLLYDDVSLAMATAYREEIDHTHS